MVCSLCIWRTETIKKEILAKKWSNEIAAEQRCAAHSEREREKIKEINEHKKHDLKNARDHNESE